MSKEESLRSKFLQRKNKGYLLVDIVVALSIMSLLFLGIGRVFNIYLRNTKYSNEKSRIIEIMRALSLEVKNNLEFTELKSLKNGVYYLGEINIYDVMEKDILTLISNGDFKEFKDGSVNGWKIKVNEIHSNEGVAKIIYENSLTNISEEEEVKIYEFLE